MLRLAKESDLSAIDAIYNQAIARRFCTADLEPIGHEKRLEWFRAHDPQQYPVFVYEESSQVLGWVSLSAYRPGRQATRGTAEITYYVDSDHQGKGIGSRLLEYTLEAAPRLGKRVIFAIVIEGNHPSLALLRKFGFEQWGFLPGVIHCYGETRGHIYLGKLLTG